MPENKQENSIEDSKTPEELNLEDAILETEREITRMTNNDPGVKAAMAAGKASGIEDYTTVWNKNFNRISRQQWDSFIVQHSDSFFYQDKNENIKAAYERKEKRQEKIK